MRSDHGHLTAYQIGCEVGQSVGLVLRPAILDRHILALDVAGFTNALPECSQKACTIGKRRAAEESYHRHRWLLRARRDRPRRRAAQCEYEFSPSDVDCHATLPPGGRVHAIEGTISRFSEGTNNAFALRNFNAIDVGLGSFTSLWLLRSTVRMSASRPKATESLRSSEMTLSARTGREQMQQTTSLFDHPRRC